MCLRTDKSRICPGIPEYFNSEGRGLYHYLTGSASWYVLTMLTQVFGVRGHYGDLLLAPKFTQSDFRLSTEVSVHTFFANRRLEVVYRNPKKISYEHYFIAKIAVNGKELKGLERNRKEALIRKESFVRLARKNENTLTVTL